jgi:hypothetical protein
MAGSGAPGTAGGAANDPAATPDAGVGTGDPGEDEGTTAKPRCLQKPSQVVLIGDSYVNWVSHTFPADLAKEAGQTFRSYAVGGTSMGSGGIGLIAPQLEMAVTEDPDIKLSVMTGGGNDVLVPDVAMFPRGAECKNSMSSASIPDCQRIVTKALDAAGKMMERSIEIGVEHVVYFFYPHVPNGTLVGGLYPNAILDYSLPRVKEFCETTSTRSGGKLTCHFVDLIPVFEGHPEYFAPTDIHPNLQGSAAMAKAIWGKMKESCIAQPASSGCCEP